MEKQSFHCLKARRLRTLHGRREQQRTEKVKCAHSAELLELDGKVKLSQQSSHNCIQGEEEAGAQAQSHLCSKAASSTVQLLISTKIICSHNQPNYGWTAGYITVAARYLKWINTDLNLQLKQVCNMLHLHWAGSQPLLMGSRLMELHSYYVVCTSDIWALYNSPSWRFLTCRGLRAKAGSPAVRML